METGYSRGSVEDPHSFNGSLKGDYKETLDFICSKCEDINNTIVKAAFYCALCDGFYCQSCQQAHDSLIAYKKHPVYDQNQMDKWGEQTRSMNPPTETCPDHPEEKLRMVCLTDNMLCCSICASVYHSSCPEMVPVQEIAKDMKQSGDLSIVNTNIDQFIELIDEMINSGKKNQTSLDKSKDDYLDSIKDLRQQVNDFFNGIERKATKEMEVFHRDKCRTLQRHMTRLHDSKDTLTKLNSTLQHQNTNNESQLLIEMMTAQQQLTGFQKEVQRLAETPQTMSFYLGINPQLQRCLDKIHNLGEIRTTKTVVQRKLPKITPLPLLQPPQSPLQAVEESDVIVSNVPTQQPNLTDIASIQSAVDAVTTPTTTTATVPADKAFMQQQQQQEKQQLNQLYTATNGRDINVKLPLDEQFCKIHGSCQLPNGNILLTDNANKKVKRLNTKYEPTDYLDLPDSPYGICCIDDTAAVVTDNNCTIHFLSIAESAMSVTQSMQLGHNCYGIAHHNERLFLSSPAKKIYIYTTSGKQLKMVQTDIAGSNIFSCTRHICVSPCDSKIYVTDCNKGLVTLDSEGNHETTYRSEYPGTCVYVDSRGRVLMCCLGSHNVLQLDDSGRLVGEIVDKSDGIIGPQSICIDTHNSTLIVTMSELGYGNNNIRVFDLK